MNLSTTLEQLQWRLADAADKRLRLRKRLKAEPIRTVLNFVRKRDPATTLTIGSDPELIIRAALEIWVPVKPIRDEMEKLTGIPYMSGSLASAREKVEIPEGVVFDDIVRYSDKDRTKRR